MEDLPKFLRELVAQHLGLRLDQINAWIDSDDESGLDRIEQSLEFLSGVAKKEQKSRAKKRLRIDANALMASCRKYHWGYVFEYFGTQEDLLAANIVGPNAFVFFPKSGVTSGIDEYGCRFSIQRRAKGQFKVTKRLMQESYEKWTRKYGKLSDTDISDILKRLQSNRPVTVRVSRSKGGAS